MVLFAKSAELCSLISELSVFSFTPCSSLMGKQKILIATWGDPSGWKNVEYYLNNKKFKSRTTYIPIFEEEKPDRGIIIVQNSLLPKFNVENEGELKDKIREMLKKFGASNSIIERTQVIVTISSGVYNNVKFNADLNDILLNLFIQLYFELKDAEEVVLDLTHGINYLPNVTLISLAYLRKVLNFKLRIYNSTPVTKNTTKSWILELGETNIEGNVRLNEKELEEIQRNLKNVLRKELKFNIIHAFKLLVSYLYGLLFPLVYNSNFDFDENFLYKLMPKQKRESGEYRVITKIASEKLFTYIFTIVLAKRIAKEFRYEKITLNTIKEIENKISNPVAKRLIENEYKIIKMFYDTHEQIFSEKDEVSYKEAQNILRSGIGDKFKKRDINELRDFFAHASFLWHEVKLKKNRELEFKNKGKMEKFVKNIKEIEL